MQLGHHFEDGSLEWKSDIWESGCECNDDVTDMHGDYFTNTIYEDGENGILIANWRTRRFVSFPVSAHCSSVDGRADERF